MPAERWEAGWRGLDRRTEERCILRRRGSGWTLQGSITGPREEGVEGIGYFMRCDAEWRTRRVRVVLRVHGLPQVLRLRGDGRGAWLVNGSRAPEVQGCLDVDLAATPATNLLPIRRLSLPIGGSSDVAVIWIRVPQLTVQRVRERFTRVAETRYRYENLDTRFGAEIEVDGQGLVTRCPGFWERLS